MYISESEGANFWLQVLTDLNNRGLKDILIACTDNLKGFTEAILSIFPKTDVQLCIVHQIRNSLKYVASKDQKEFMRDLKLVYRAAGKEEAEDELLNLEKKWGKKYPRCHTELERQLGAPLELLWIFRPYQEDNIHHERRGGLPQAGT